MSSTSKASPADQGSDDALMYRPPERDEEPEVTLGDITQRIRDAFSGLPGFGGGSRDDAPSGDGEERGRSSGRASAVVLLLIPIVAIVWLATGIYTVGPEEQAALRTFGKFVAIADQGLHWHWPGPVGTRNVVPVTTTRRLELGFRSGANGSSTTPVQIESEMITGDENIVDVQVVVQYRISNLRNFLFEVDDPGDPDRNVPSGLPDGETLRDIAETAVRQVVGARNIDDVLTTEKEQVQASILEKMRELTRDYNTGIDVLQVLLQNVNPPAEVQDAFEDVVRAREDRERDINLAEAYKAAQIPQATGSAAQIVEEADGFKRGRIERARGEAEGFKAILEGYEESPKVTRTRLYLEAVERILAGKSKIVINSGSNALPLLPLDSLGTLSGNSLTNTVGGE
jgi:membrane protease subunit HflK